MGTIPTALAELHAIVDEFPDEDDAHFALGRLYGGHTGEIRRAEHHLRRVIEIDPLNKLVYNQLAYGYANARNLEKAIWAVSQYVELAPDEHNPYDSRGEIYAHFGLVDSAMSSYRTACEINPRFFPTQLKIGGLYFLQGEYERAELEFRKVLSLPIPQARSLVRICLGVIPLHRGEMRNGIAGFRKHMAVDESEGLSNDWGYSTKSMLVARAHLSIGEVDRGLAVFDTLFSHTSEAKSIFDARNRAFYAIELARLGRFDDARAQADIAESEMRAVDPDFIDAAYLTHAFVDLLEGDITSARQNADSSLALGDDFTDQARLYLALCDLASGDLAAAAAELEFQCAYARQGRMLDPFWSAELRYHLARAYDQLGETDKAMARYREFLDIWRDADPEIRLIVRDPRDPDDRPLEFARRRLEALRSGI
jgi:tetratricopeptide (TPR) repeat protein